MIVIEWVQRMLRHTPFRAPGNGAVRNGAASWPGPYKPTEAQLHLAREQEKIRDMIRLRALRANVDVLTGRDGDTDGRTDHH